MNVELGRIETQLRQIFEGDAWHGPALLEALNGLTAEEAAAHPLAGAHSIWEIVLHLRGTYELVLRRIEGQKNPLAPAEDWPAIPAISDKAWNQAVESLRDSNARLRQAVLGFDPDGLDRNLIPAPTYPAYQQFIGVTQHDAYHAGQIVMLKKALRKR